MAKSYKNIQKIPRITKLRYFLGIPIKTECCLFNIICSID